MTNMDTIIRGGRVVLHVLGALEAVQAALDVYAGKEGALC